MKPTGKTYYCKYCGCIEFIPFEQDGITLDQTESVYCPGPKCAGRGHKRQMYEVEGK